MKKTNNLISIRMSVMLLLPLMLGACVLPMMSTSSTAIPAQSALPQQFSGGGISVNEYQVSLKAGMTRFHVVADGALTIDFTGPAVVSEVMHTGIPADNAYEVQIPADGTYKIIVNHAGLGSWMVTVEAPGAAAPQPTAQPAIAQQPTVTSVAEESNPPPGGAQQFSGSGISVNEYQVTLTAGLNRLHVSAANALTVDFTGPAAVSQVQHTGLSVDGTYEVQIPADGVYKIAINHGGLGSWMVTIEVPGSTAPQPATTQEPAAATAAEDPTSAPAVEEPVSVPGAAEQFSGSGISVNVYQVTFKAGIAYFHVVTGGALTVDFTGSGAVNQLQHPGLPADTTHEIRIPVDGIYEIVINHAGLSSWTVTITQ
jgi:hypothetical protein